MSNGLNNWSFSTLMNYESCPLRVKFAKVDKLPELPRPADNPLERGNREHELLDNYVKNKVLDLSGSTCKAIDEFLPVIEHAKELYTAGMATAEQNWWFDENWMPTEDRSKIWLWSKLDLSVTDENQKCAIAIDYKTGKSGYKTVEHVQQLQLYSGITALKYEWAETVYAELYYLDEGWIRTSEYTRDEALVYIGMFERRADKLMNEKIWKPNPNVHTCRFCPYGPKAGTGVCPVGV